MPIIKVSFSDSEDLVLIKFKKLHNIKTKGKAASSIVRLYGESFNDDMDKKLRMV